jgi:hypothetical protein
MGTEAERWVLPAVLRAYLLTARGSSASAELVERLRQALAPDCLGPLVRTEDDVHAVRATLEKMDAVQHTAPAKRA